MSERLIHRGPDGEGTRICGSTGLVHRRLAIIDLSEEGLQPMTNEDGTLWLVFNGEIYNYVELREELVRNGHRFHSHSDTEVILHAYEEWGDACLNRFNGMWAFALWDGRQQRLFCARDRLGIKPFYYTQAGGSFLFASEIKALLAHPDAGTRPHDLTLGTYLAWGVLDHSGRTMFEGILQLEPAHAMVVTAAGPEKPFRVLGCDGQPCHPFRHFGQRGCSPAPRDPPGCDPDPPPERCRGRHVPLGGHRLLDAHGAHQ